MKGNINHCKATYGPQNFKNFPGALEAFFAEECPQIGGQKTRRGLVQNIVDMVNSFYPSTTNMRQGQVLWTTVDKNEKSSYGKGINQTRLTQVILDLVRPEDASERAEGKKLRDIKMDAVARMFMQAYEQGGCMTNAEMALLLKISPQTVSKYTLEWEKTRNRQLPRRGTIHDMGRTLTHKKEIVRKLFLEGKTVEDVSRETYHSPEAINRYIVAFKQVLMCRKNGLTIEDTAFAVKMSKSLVMEYWNMIDEIKAKSIFLDDLLNIMDKME